MHVDTTGLYTDPEGQTLCDIALRRPDGEFFAALQVRAAGRTDLGAGSKHARTGVSSVVMADEGREFVLEEAAWDDREWQWWRGHGPYASYEDAFRPRLAPATAGLAIDQDSVCVTSEYTADGIRTHQTWVFRAPQANDGLSYDCHQTITNTGPTDLLEYGQFFACYTEPNRDRSQFYWANDGQLRTFASIGAKHLDAYIVAPGSTFAHFGHIPHAMRGGGRVADTWRYPVLVGQPTPKAWRHIILCDPRRTAGLASGMTGIAMDYIVYPGGEVLKAGQTFTSVIRHHVLLMPDPIDSNKLAGLWQAFAADEPSPAGRG